MFNNPRLVRLRQRSREFLTRFARHEDIYDTEYFASVDASSTVGADAMARTLLGKFNASRIVDIGCGTGSLLLAFRKAGIHVEGFDYSEPALGVCREKGLSVQRLNLESGELPPAPQADLAVSFEVAEHLDARHADGYIAFLTQIAPNLAFSAATPGQGGHDHVNEQPHSYWIEKIEAAGLHLLPEPTRETRAEWSRLGVPNEYSANVLLFSRGSR